MNLPFRRPGGERPGSQFDARPLVAVRRQDRTGWWFAGGALVAALLLFTTLEARRQAVEQGSKEAQGGGLIAPQPVPDLVVPIMPLAPSPSATGPWLQPGDPRLQRSVPVQPGTSRQVAPLPAYSPPIYESPYASPPPMPPMGADGNQAPSQPTFNAPPAAPAASPATGSNIQARRLENPASTVIQGSLINAVLETAIDSTSPGQTRAVVTRDVYGFDGTRILIPRGTRLYGIYESDVVQGQKRAQIRWSRLLTPEGVSVALDSPAADPLGRAGVAARVNTHFFQRLGNALLGTASAVGSTLVTRNIGTSPVIVAVPGSAQAATQVAGPGPSQIMPTLTVKQGTRISVFVQHDLDLSTIDEAQGQ